MVKIRKKFVTEKRFLLIQTNTLIATFDKEK